MRACALPDCSSPAHGRGYCGMHYARLRRTGSTELLTPWARFWAKVDATGICWEWTAAKTRFGYGAFRTDKRWHRAHRWAYEQLVGPIQDGLELDHLCRNPSCVNPDHLEPVTRAVNNERSNSLSARRKRQVACNKGHDFTEENTYRDKLGRRYCITCQRARDRARTIARRERRVAA